VHVDERGEFQPEIIELSSPRKFIVIEQEFTGITAHKITEQVFQNVKEADEEGVVIIPVLKGVLPAEASRAEIDLPHIRSAAEEALLVHPIVLLRESSVSEEVVRSIFEGEFKDLKTKSFEFFFEIFSERYSKEEAEKVARLSIGLIDPLSRKQDEKVRRMLEELKSED
jgi:hypothetical protein